MIDQNLIGTDMPDSCGRTGQLKTEQANDKGESPHAPLKSEHFEVEINKLI
jgi:hypothetical protein